MVLKKILFLLIFLFPNDTSFRFLLPIPNSEFGCYIGPVQSTMKSTRTCDLIVVLGSKVM
jgi:hypothetical protein